MAKWIGRPSKSRCQPSVGPRRAEAGQVGDQQGPAGLQHPRHLGDGRLRVLDVDQAEAADHQVEAGVGKVQRLGASLDITPLGVAVPRRRQKFLGRIQPHGLEALGAKDSAEPPFPAADIQRHAAWQRAKPRRHRTVEHILAAEITGLAHVGDPGLGRAFPTAVVHPSLQSSPARRH
jgi:hypothetical protein